MNHKLCINAHHRMPQTLLVFGLHGTSPKCDTGLLNWHSNVIGEASNKKCPTFHPLVTFSAVQICSVHVVCIVILKSVCLTTQ